MINYKLQHNLTMVSYQLKHKPIGSQNFPQISKIFIKGIPSEPKVSSKNTEKENEKIVQSWKNVAVLRATSEQPTKIYIGYYDKNALAYFKHEFQTNLEYAMRIGPGDVNFFIFPKDLKTEVKLEIMEQTTQNNPKYKDLIVI